MNLIKFPTAFHPVCAGWPAHLSLADRLDHILADRLENLYSDTARAKKIGYSDRAWSRLPLTTIPSF